MGFFGWLEEGAGEDVGFADCRDGGGGCGEDEETSGKRGCEEGVWLKGSRLGDGGGANAGGGSRGNRFRLERFGKAMTGNTAWEPPGGVLNGSFTSHPSLTSLRSVTIYR